MKETFKKYLKKFAAPVFAVVGVLSTSIVAFAEDAEGVSAAKSLLTQAQSTLNITNVVAILGAGIGAVLGLFLAWWGARKLFNMLKGAITRGSAKL